MNEDKEEAALVDTSKQNDKYASHRSFLGEENSKSQTIEVDIKENHQDLSISRPLNNGNKVVPLTEQKGDSLEKKQESLTDPEKEQVD